MMVRQKQKTLLFRIVIIHFTVVHIEIPAVNLDLSRIRTFPDPRKGQQVLHGKQNGTLLTCPQLRLRG